MTFVALVAVAAAVYKPGATTVGANDPAGQYTVTLPQGSGDTVPAAHTPEQGTGAQQPHKRRSGRHRGGTSTVVTTTSGADWRPRFRNPTTTGQGHNIQRTDTALLRTHHSDHTGRTLAVESSGAHAAALA